MPNDKKPGVSGTPPAPPQVPMALLSDFLAGSWKQGGGGWVVVGNKRRGRSCWCGEVMW